MSATSGGPDPAVVAAVERLIADGLAAPRGGAFVLGLCGAQGSGKSTLAAVLAERANAAGLPAITLSLDDLYLTAAERQVLGETVHLLFRTRGVPGTHDVSLGLALLDNLDVGRAVPVPQFDKATDDRAPVETWPIAPVGTRLVILEGWCVGAAPEDPAALADPINPLERDEDSDAVWRRAVNAQLADAYQRLFARIDRLMLLAAPSFDIVLRWRIEQEQGLRAARGSGGMSDEALARFVRHYERITRHILREMPARADLTVRLDDDRRPIRIGAETIPT